MVTNTDSLEGMGLGSSVQDYLKAIYELSAADHPCSTSRVAERMGVTPAAVSKMVRRLRDLKLARQDCTQEIALTPAGERIALEILRHHRLLEVYLMEALGYTWDQVDGEAEKLEHVISEEFEDRIASMLGHPTHDPHGDPIPTKDGRIEAISNRTMDDLRLQESAVVCRVIDQDPSFLRYVGALGLYPGTAVTMVGREPFGGPLRVSVNGVEHAVGSELATRIFVSEEDGER